MSDVWKFLSGLAASAAALAATVLVPGSSGPGDGTRLGSMSPDTVLYTKAQADIVFSAQSGSVPTNMSQLVDDVGYAKTDDIPTRVSQLSNDSGFLTEHQSLAGLAHTGDIPTKVSQLTNDSGFLTEHQSLAGLASTNDIPTKVSQLANDSGFLTEHQSLDGLAHIGDIPTKVSQLTNDTGFLTEHQSLAGLASTNDIPTKVSQLTNDTGFLTEHQSLAGLASTNDIPTKVSQLANDAGYATMSADYNKGSLTISAVKPGEDGLFLKIFNKDGCPAISAGTIGAAEEDLAEVYAYGAPSIDSMTNSLWTAIGRTYTQSEVEELIAQAIAAVMGPFAIEEDENGRPVMVRRESVQSLQTFLKVSNGSDTNNEQNGSFRTATQE